MTVDKITQLCTDLSDGTVTTCMTVQQQQKTVVVMSFHHWRLETDHRSQKGKVGRK